MDSLEIIRGLQKEISDLNRQLIKNKSLERSVKSFEENKHISRMANYYAEKYSLANKEIEQMKINEKKLEKKIKRLKKKAKIIKKDLIHYKKIKNFTIDSLTENDIKEIKQIEKDRIIKKIKNI